MSIAKNKRQVKRQMGQFLTPPSLACEMVENMNIRREHKILEPSMGDGSFILPLIEQMMQFYRGSISAKLAAVLKNNIYGVELDRTLYDLCLRNIEAKWGQLPDSHNFVCGDFLTTRFLNDSGQSVLFDHIIGNPPFGGTLVSAYQDALDKKFGFRGGLKIKKETYAFFIVKSMDMLCHGGILSFVCSDTFLTIKTMKGLRAFLMNSGDVCIDKIPFFSDEVSQQTVHLKCEKGEPASEIHVNGGCISEQDILATPNYSWQISGDMVKFFHGKKAGDMMTATSGMTVGKNEYFVREIINGEITEPFDFTFYQKPVTLADAIARARMGHLSEAAMQRIAQQEAQGGTVRDLRVCPKSVPEKITLPHPDYRPYNKASKGIIYAPPKNVIFWRDDGDAVYTYKKNGNWYLWGVGGKKHFFREGITWNLISGRLRPRYLPAGHILDSGAPCAFLKPGIDQDETFFLLAWGLTDLCNYILKTIINHTKNIQGKDFERLPYPFWVDARRKSAAVSHVREMIQAGMEGYTIDPSDRRIGELNAMFSSGNDNFESGFIVPVAKHFRQMPLNMSNIVIAK